MATWWAPSLRSIVTEKVQALFLLLHATYFHHDPLLVAGVWTRGACRGRQSAARLPTKRERQLQGWQQEQQQQQQRRWRRRQQQNSSDSEMKEWWGFMAGVGGVGSAESASWRWSEKESAATKRCSLFTPSPVEKKNVSEGWQSESSSTMQDLHYLGLSCLCDNRVGSDSFQWPWTWSGGCPPPPRDGLNTEFKFPHDWACD